jgi:hypothetical protein
VDRSHTWQALQQHLTDARVAMDADDRTTARERLDAALAIDPGCVAAVLLRERLDAPVSTPVPSEVSGTAGLATAEAVRRPLVSAEGFARFEQRTRLRRIERCATAARDAIARGRIGEAREALAEIQHLNAEAPELRELQVHLDLLQTQRDAAQTAHLFAARESIGAGRSSWGRFMASAAVFLLGIVAATWVENTTRRTPAAPATNAAPNAAAAGPEIGAPPADFLIPRSVVPAEPADVESPVNRFDALPSLLPRSTGGFSESGARQTAESPRAASTMSTLSADPRVVGTNGVTSSLTPDVTARPRAVVGSGANRFDASGAATNSPPTIMRVANPPLTNTGLTNVLVDAVTTAAFVPPPAPAPIPARDVAPPSTPALVTSSASTPSNSVVATTNAGGMPDDESVRRTLQRYRAAYTQLDARSASAVWPSVNQEALARAFDGLSSQELTFDACSVQVQGVAATATCRGSARYVPRVGSRVARVEARSWNFALRKAGDSWLIESARADR